MADMAALPRFGVICKDVGVIDVLQMFVSMFYCIKHLTLVYM